MRDDVNLKSEEINVYCFSGTPQFIVKINSNNTISIWDKNLKTTDNIFEFSNKNIKIHSDLFIKKALEVSEKLSNISKLSDAVFDSGQSMTTSVDQLSEVNRGINEETAKVSENVINLTSGVTKASFDVTAAIKSMQEDISKLTNKIDAYNGLMKTALEQYSTLSEQDVRVLEKIAEKIQ